MHLLCVMQFLEGPFKKFIKMEEEEYDGFCVFPQSGNVKPPHRRFRSNFIPPTTTSKTIKKVYNIVFLYTLLVCPSSYHYEIAFHAELTTYHHHPLSSIKRSSKAVKKKKKFFSSSSFHSFPWLNILDCDWVRRNIQEGWSCFFFSMKIKYNRILPSSSTTQSGVCYKAL